MTKLTERVLVGAILLLFAVISYVGITWGLPSRAIDPYLFGDKPAWSGETIYRLAGGAEKLSAASLANRGADVDLDPLARTDGEPVLLTGTDADVARILLRYRLYTYQPDEMITMMALAGMRPREGKLDPRLYQYGGLFIYPVGGLIGAAGVLGLIDVRSDVVHYLDNPDEFGRFYIVARGYAAAWGLVGVLAVFAIGRRLGGSRVALLAALLFTLMPVVVCMAHEGKPHLPGAVLMLLAVLFAMRHLRMGEWRLMTSEAHPPRPHLLREGKEEGRHSGEDVGAEHACVAHGRASQRDWWLMCVCCGAALGMVLSSSPIFVLVPLVALMEGRGGDGPSSNRFRRFVVRVTAGVGVGALVYLVTNPYVPVNAVVNREVLQSNFGNSLAMYQIDRIGEGLVRVLELTVEGATLPVLVLGVVALVVGWIRSSSHRVVAGDATPPRPPLLRGGEEESASASAAASPRLPMLPLAIPALVFFVQFVLIGAGKPGEYGRFGVFTNTAMAIGAACLLVRPWTGLREVVNWLPALFVVVWCGFFGAAYLANFHADCTEVASRLQVRRASLVDDRDAEQPDPWLAGHRERKVAVCAEPAPYGCPPLPFGASQVYLFDSCEAARKVAVAGEDDWTFVRATDRRTGSTGESGSGFRHVFPEQVGPSGGGGWSLSGVETPISWANKPFELVYSGGRQKPSMEGNDP